MSDPVFAQPATAVVTTHDRARWIIALLCLLPVLAAFSARGTGFAASGVGLLIFIEALCCRRATLLAALQPWKNRRLTMSGWLILIIALSFVSTLWALNAGVSISRALKIAPQFLGGGALLMAAPWLARNMTAQEKKHWFIAYGISLLIMAADMISGMKLHHFLYRGAEAAPMRVDALNRGVLVDVFLFLPTLGLIFAPNNNAFIGRQRWVLTAIFTVLMLLMLHSTGSQSAQLAFALAVLALLVPVQFRGVWIILAFALSALIFVTPWLSQYLMRDVAPALPTMPFLGRGQGYAANRIEIWDYVSRYALQKPWLGFGIDSTRAVTAFDSHQIYQPGITIPHPHNFAVQLWMEFGVVGAILGAGLTLTILHYLRAQPSLTARRLGLGTFLACLSAAAMTYSTWQGWWLGLLFFVAAMIRLIFSLYPRDAHEKSV